MEENNNNNKMPQGAKWYPSEAENKEKKKTKLPIAPIFHLIISIITTRVSIEEKKRQRNQRRIERKREK
jgi:hypothetical protein